MITDNRVWPEGVCFTEKVNLPTQDDLVEVEITFRVPPFETVVEIHNNRDPQKAYPLFRQFISDWDLEEELSDYVLMSFLAADIRISEVVFAAWADHMKEYIATRQVNVMQAPTAVN